MAIAEADADKTSVEIKVEDFSRLVVGMSRLLTGLARIPPFVEGGLSMAEWISLTMLAQRDGISNKLLGRSLGVSAQRANQICASLVRSGLIAITQSAEDNRANDIKITEAGKAKIDSINAQLQPMLAGAMAGKERSLSGAARHIKFVGRILQTVSPEKARKKEKKKEKKRAKD